MAKTEDGLVQAVVANRRSVIVQDKGGVNRRAGPGSIVKLPEEEVRTLTAAGFLVSKADAAASAGRPSQPAALPQPTVNGRTGNQVGPDAPASPDGSGEPQA